MYRCVTKVYPGFAADSSPKQGVSCRNGRGDENKLTAGFGWRQYRANLAPIWRQEFSEIYGGANTAPIRRQFGIG